MTAVLKSSNKENLQRVLDFATQMGVVVSVQKKKTSKKTESVAKPTWDYVPVAKKHHSLKKEPVFGCAKGKMWFADDFDAPLEGFEEYM